MNAIEKNDHYGMLNRRFDERAGILIGFGFKYQHVPALSIAVFTRSKYGKTMSIAAGAVMNADSVVWGDEVERVERFANGF